MKNITTLILALAVAQVFGQNALSFDGLDDKVDCGNHPSIQLSTLMTLEAWIFPTSWRTNVWEGGIAVKEQNSSNNGYMFRAGNNGRLNIAFGFAGLPWRELTTAPNTLTLNTWQHVAGVYNGSMLKLYVNGIAVDSIAATGSIGNATSNLFVGGYYALNRNFPGRIDEVRIWNVARSQAEIAANMNAEFCGTPTGLVAYYKFNQGIAGGTNTGLTTLTDETGTNNGTLVGFALTGATSNWTTGAAITPGIGGTGSVTVTACDSYSLPGSSTVFTTTGVFTDTISSAFGCDSIITLNLTINNSTSSNQTITACNKYVSPSGNYTWATSGSYTDTIANAAGCDSVINIALTIQNIDVTVLQNGVVLGANLTGGTYQWLDCDNNFAQISGATAQAFVATANGNYAVQVSKDGCTDTSICYAVSGIGIGEHMLLQNALIYPQPSNGSFTIALPVEVGFIDVTLTNSAGAVVYTTHLEGSNEFFIQTKLPAGVYIIRLQTAKSSAVQRVVIQ